MPEPAVGIFWRVAGTLVVDRTPLSRAEPYGDCLTHGPGHYERWEAWQRLGARGLREQGYPGAILGTEYDDWPRGVWSTRCRAPGSCSTPTGGCSSP